MIAGTAVSRGEGMRHRKHRIGLGLGALALTAAVAASALLAFATGGNAASSKACTQQNLSTANCVVTSVAPIVLSTNQNGLAAVKFKNVFGKANATHTAVSLVLPAGVTVASTATPVSSNPAALLC